MGAEDNYGRPAGRDKAFVHHLLNLREHALHAKIVFLRISIAGDLILGSRGDPFWINLRIVSNFFPLSKNVKKKFTDGIQTVAPGTIPPPGLSPPPGTRGPHFPDLFHFRTHHFWVYYHFRTNVSGPFS